jgi:hypothetical protein
MVAAAVAWVRAARPELTADQAAQVVRLGAQDVGGPGWEASTGYGVLNLPGALAHEAPTADPLEPNDDVEFVNGSVLGRRSRPVFTGAAASLAALLDRYEDPVDVYRILIPARATVRIRLVPAFGDPDLVVYTPAARTVTGSRALVGRSMRRGRRVDGVVLANPLPRRVTRFVAVALGDGVASLDAGYTLRVMRR